MMPVPLESTTQKAQATLAYSSVGDTTDVESQASQRRAVRIRLPAIAVGSLGFVAGATWLCSRPARPQQRGRHSDAVLLDDAGDGDRPWQMGDPNWWNVKCPGELNIEGLGNKQFVNAYFNRPHEQAGGSYADTKTQKNIEVSLAGRGYLGESCTNGETDARDPGSYEDVEYSRLYLLGKKLSYDMDFNGVGCGWDASLALSAMPDNKDPGECHDFYCDPMRVCGVACTEVTLQEANMMAWFSTLHTKNDGKGVGVGYGGGDDEAPRRDWDAKKYGPDGKCINTKSVFRVALSFPMDAKGELKSMDVELSQDGCKVSASIDEYPSRGGKKSMAEISKAMQQGMTLVFGLWGSPMMGWLDGKGWDEAGPCSPEDESPATDVLADQDSARWGNFTLEDLPEPEPEADDSEGSGASDDFGSSGKTSGSGSGQSGKSSTASGKSSAASGSSSKSAEEAEADPAVPTASTGSSHQKSNRANSSKKGPSAP